jgi:hypothetical protein
MKTFKTLALIAALSVSAFASTTFAADGRYGTEPLSIKVCNADASCQSPNGPSLDGLAQPSGIKVCNPDNSCMSPNGPSESGLADLKLGTVIIAIHMP